jgi:hypothetical protein
MLIHTTKGEIEEALLTRQDGSIDNEVEATSWVEYWQGGVKHEHVFDMHAAPRPDGSRPCLSCDAELVHRSVDMTLKQAATFAEGVAGIFT